MTKENSGCRGGSFIPFILSKSHFILANAKKAEKSLLFT